jgi:alpha-galactosidase
MAPTDSLNVFFHFGGEFIHIGHQLEYIGGDEAITAIPRDKITMSEIKGHLGDYMTYRDSMKLYYHISGKDS